MLAYRFEISLERTRESILPEIKLVGEFSLSDLESLGSNVDVLEAEFVCKMNEGQRNKIAIETLGNVSGSEAELGGISYRRNSS